MPGAARVNRAAAVALGGPLPVSNPKAKAFVEDATIDREDRDP
jgi:hypothetical protein